MSKTVDGPKRYRALGSAKYTVGEHAKYGRGRFTFDCTVIREDGKWRLEQLRFTREDLGFSIPTRISDPPKRG